MSKTVNCKYKENLDIIKTGILSLKATGRDGFEGLLRIALTNLTGIPFRLAASGLQGGVDGDSVMPGDPVCFEAKRYSGDINRNDVLAKIVDLARNKDAADRLWILGATIEINTQLASTIQEDGDQNAVSTFILDWTATPLPLLAITVIAAGDIAIDFICKNYQGRTNQKKLTKVDLASAFTFIKHHPEFENLLQKLKSNLNISKLALKRAIDLNMEWRKETFSSKSRARERLGQGLAVLKQPFHHLMRYELRNHILSEIQTGKEVILLGDEGHGKSWLAAQICSNAEGLSLFISAEQLEGVSVENLDDFLIHLLIKQTSEVANEALKHRWRHRLKTWKITPPLASLLVIVDGLNQRQNFRWDRLLNGIQSRLAEIGGHMIVTVRPQFWRKEILRGLAFKPATVEIPEWSSLERDELLKCNGIALSWLDQQTLQALKNPRLLSVAISTLPHKEAIAWKGLTTDRLLMEHLRTSQLEKYEDESFLDLTKRLSEHATKVLERVQLSANIPPHNFQTDTRAVIETRFFRSLPGPNDLYELREEGLTLALGFTLVDQLWQTLSMKRDLEERVLQIVEPINAMDRTADVLFASLLICTLDDVRFDTEIYSVLLHAFSDLQNLSDRRFEEFVEIVKHQPQTFFEVLKEFCLEKEQRLNKDWFTHAALKVARSKEGWQTAENAIHHWLGCYNKDPIIQVNHYYRENSPEYENKLEEKKAEIKKTLSSLSTYEKQILARMTEVSSATEELFTLALRLLAGHSLVSFADSFVAMGLAFALDKNIYSARKAFQQLTTFNRIDRDETRNAFLKAIEPLYAQDTSEGGQWTVVRMLYATGKEKDAVTADRLAKNLRKNWHNFESTSQNKWRQLETANPNSKVPVDMDEGTQQFRELDPDKMFQSMYFGSEDRCFNDFLPVACRFSPDIAIKKTRNILEGMVTRSGLPLRQIILNCLQHIPLMYPDLAENILSRARESDAFGILPEKDISVCRKFVFYYAAVHISAGKQLEYMTSKVPGPNYLLSVIPSLKHQPTAEIVSAVQEALRNDNEDEAYGALVAARYGNTQVNDELEELILKCSYGESSNLRAIAFELATHKDLNKVRQAHCYSNWCASSSDENVYEDWYGSILLIEACAQGEMSIDCLLSRISYKTWFATLSRLNTDFTKILVDNFVKQLRKGITATGKITPPLADLNLSRTDPVPFPLISLEESTRDSVHIPRSKSLEEVLDINDNFDDKQSRLNAAADVFFQELKGSKAKLLVQEITIDIIQDLVAKVPTLLDELTNIVVQAESTQLIWLKNLAFIVANIISAKSPELAVKLLNRASRTQGFLTLFVDTDLTLEHQAIWGSSASKPMETLWRQRLLGSKNNAILAQEVLAAERFGASSFINSLVFELISSDDSLDRAYAISIAGYSIYSTEFNDIISKYIDNKGICGNAAKYSLREYQKAQWAQTWITSMWSAPTPEEFWRCLIIATTSMDARVQAVPQPNSRWHQYAPVFHRARKAAIKERNKERNKKLLGQEAPELIFTSFNHEIL
ncbi:TPA: hypothetical protein MFF89_001149 [Klebsiella pneumoniae]|nr:hypothetical protein [Klebsiella pneumoniae]